MYQPYPTGGAEPAAGSTPAPPPPVQNAVWLM